MNRSACIRADDNIGTDNLTTSSGFARDFEVKSSDNPIDKAFSKDFDVASSPELNFLASAYLDAWQAELFKKQVLYLVDKYFSETSEYVDYTYLYKGKGAEFDKAE